MKEKALQYKILSLFVVFAWMMAACAEGGDGGGQKTSETIRTEVMGLIPQPRLVSQDSLPSLTNSPYLSTDVTIDDNGFICAARDPNSQYSIWDTGPKMRGYVDGKPITSFSEGQIVPGEGCIDSNTSTQVEFSLNLDLGSEGSHSVRIGVANCALTDELTGSEEEICGSELNLSDQTITVDQTPPIQKAVNFQRTEDGKLVVTVDADENYSFSAQAVIGGLSAGIDKDGKATVIIDPQTTDLAEAESVFYDQAGNYSRVSLSSLAGDAQPPDFSLNAISVGNPEIAVDLSLADVDTPQALVQLSTVNVQGAKGRATVNGDTASIVLPRETNLTQVSVKVCDAFQHCLTKTLAGLTGDTQPPAVLSVGPVTFSQGAGSFDVTVTDDVSSLLSLSSINIGGQSFPVVPFQESDGTTKGIAHVTVNPQQLGLFSFTFTASDAFKHETPGSVAGSYDPCPKEVARVTIGDDGKTVTLTIPTNNNLNSYSFAGQGYQVLWPDVLNNLPFLTKVREKTGLVLADGVQLTFTTPAKHGDLLMRLDMKTVNGFHCSLNYTVTQMPEMTDREKLVVYLKLAAAFFASDVLLTAVVVKKIRKIKKTIEDQRINSFRNFLTRAISTGQDISTLTLDGQTVDQLLVKLAVEEREAWLMAKNDTQLLIAIRRSIRENDLPAAYKNLRALYKKTPKEFLAKERDKLFLRFMAGLNSWVSQVIISNEDEKSFSILKSKDEVIQYEEMIKCIDDLYGLSNHHPIWEKIILKAKQVKGMPEKIREGWQLTRENIEKVTIAYYYSIGELPIKWAELQTRFGMQDDKIREAVEAAVEQG